MDPQWQLDSFAFAISVPALVLDGQFKFIRDDQLLTIERWSQLFEFLQQELVLSVEECLHLGGDLHTKGHLLVLL
jgi:hypothetical protein